MNVEMRAKRILNALDNYQPVDGASSSISSFQVLVSLRKAKPLGIYRNHLGSGKESILVSDVGLFLIRGEAVTFVDYRAIKSVDVTANGSILDARSASSKTEADGLLINVDGPSPVFLPVRNSRGKYRDAFEFYRFVSRAAEDSKAASEDLDLAYEDVKLARQAS